MVVALPDRHDAECILDREGARRRRLAASEGEGVGAPLTLRVDVDAGHAVGHDVDQRSCWCVTIIRSQDLWVGGSQGLMVGGHWTSALYFGDFYAEGMHNGPKPRFQVRDSRFRVSFLRARGSRLIFQGSWLTQGVDVALGEDRGLLTEGRVRDIVDNLGYVAEAADGHERPKLLRSWGCQ